MVALRYGGPESSVVTSGIARRCFATPTGHVMMQQLISYKFSSQKCGAGIGKVQLASSLGGV